MKELIKPNYAEMDFNVVQPECDSDCAKCGVLSCHCQIKDNTRIEEEVDILF